MQHKNGVSGTRHVAASLWSNGTSTASMLWASQVAAWGGTGGMGNPTGTARQSTLAAAAPFREPGYAGPYAQFGRYYTASGNA